MNSPFAWPGGKRYLKKLLLRLLPEHRAYVEVFAGSAKLLFAKEPSRWEIVNDLNDDIVNFFRVAKHRPAELAELFEQDIIHGERFRELRRLSDQPCEMGRALRFAYLVWWSFGGKGEHFAGHTIEQLEKMRLPVKRSLAVVRDLLTKTSARLGNVLIDKRDFTECIRRYDSRSTFFYCDPPYVHFRENGQYGPMPLARHEELFAALKKARGNFLLSYDDCEEVRELARSMKFNLRCVSVLYTLGSNAKPKPVSELIISNREIPATMLAQAS